LHRISNHTGPAMQVFSDIVGQNPRYHRVLARDDGKAVTTTIPHHPDTGRDRRI